MDGQTRRWYETLNFQGRVVQESATRNFFKKKKSSIRTHWNSMLCFLVTFKNKPQLDDLRLLSPLRASDAFSCLSDDFLWVFFNFLSTDRDGEFNIGGGGGGGGRGNGDGGRSSVDNSGRNGVDSSGRSGDSGRSSVNNSGKSSVNNSGRNGVNGCGGGIARWAEWFRNRRSFVHLLVRSIRSLVRLLRATRFTLALPSAHSFAHSLIHSRAPGIEVF